MDVKRYVDVNVFIYWLGDHPTYGETAYRWVRLIERSSRGKYVTSSLTIYEILVIMAGLTGRNLRDKQLVESIVNAITHLKGLVIVRLEPEDYVRAAELMKEYGLDYEDLLHLAAALKAGAKEIVTNDADFDNTPLKRIF